MSDDMPKVQFFKSRSGRWDGWFVQISPSRWVGVFPTEAAAQDWAREHAQQKGA